MKKIVDFVGRDIRVNDNVAWPVQSGHRIDMRRGQVVKLNDSGSISVRPLDQDCLVSVKRVDNVIVLL
jgi:hypothetical protein